MTKFPLYALIEFTLAGSALQAQVSTASVYGTIRDSLWHDSYGTIRDSLGAAIPGAAVASLLNRD